MTIEKKTVVYINEEIEHDTCCGIKEVGGFQSEELSFNRRAPWKDDGYDTKPDWWRDNATELARESYDNSKGEPEFDTPGTGMFTAAFIDSKDCKAAYEVLCKEHKLLYQSAPRVNDKSSNKVFLCVFLHKDKMDRKTKGEYSARPGEKLPNFMGRS